MTENNESMNDNTSAPVAQAPQAAFAPTAAPSRTRRPLLFAGAAALALTAGLGGYVAGDHGHVERIRQVSDNRGFGQPLPGQPGMGQPLPGQQGMGPHCEDASRNHAQVNADGTCPDGFTLDNGPQGMGMGMGMGPHCENTAGDHKAVNADGSCPTGYTLDDRGGANVLPNASPGTQG
jgi:hypothetical protein